MREYLKRLPGPEYWQRYCSWNLQSLYPLIAIESREYFVINALVKSCYKDVRSCNKAIYYYNRDF